MVNFCDECGKVLKGDIAYCTNCGSPAHQAGAMAEQPDVPAEAPAKRPFGVARGIATTLMGCAAFACGSAAVVLFGVGGYLLHSFAAGVAVAFPWVVAGALSGGVLVVAATAAMIIAAMFLLGAAELVRRTVALSRKPQGAKDADASGVAKATA